MEKKRANADLRAFLKENGVALWQVGDLLGVSETTVIKHLRRELSQDEKDHIRELVLKEESKDE